MEPTGIEPVTSCLQSRSGVAEGRRLAPENWIPVDLLAPASVSQRDNFVTAA